MSTPMSPVGKMRLTITLLLIIRVSSVDLPTISFLQKSPSSPVTCHATGFSPEEAVLFWTKDGKELTEGVDHGEIIPNHDGTFQKSVELNVSSVPPEDWDKYICVFQFTESKEIISVRLDKKDIQTNSIYPASRFPLGVVIGAIVGFLIIAIVFVGVCKYKQSMNNTNTLPCGRDTTI